MMVNIDLNGQNALITGGTKGIGLASALKLAEAGARAFLTYKWGSADQEKIQDRFAALGAPAPFFLQADVSAREDGDALFAAIRQEVGTIDLFINNVGFAARTETLADYKKRSLYKTFDYSSWPLIDYTRRIYEVFGRYPRRIVAISSDGPDHFYPGYDFVAASKALLEHFSRYLSVRLQDEGTRVNALRFGTVNTESFALIFGKDFFDYAHQNGVGNNRQLTAEQCGDAVLAVCSGLLDAMNGQIVHIDNGLPFQDNLMNRYLSSLQNDKEES